jgi:pimeloyl-ACP methyl ester carboxylesterase
VLLEKANSSRSQMQTHLAMRTLSATRKPDKEVEVLFALNPNRKAILFIHGFSGCAVLTWSKFSTLFPPRPNGRQRDLFFYGYDGLRADLMASAALFRDFLTRFFAEGFVNTHLPEAMQRPEDFIFEEVLIAAHSLGAVIARRALLDATKMGLDWPKRTRLILYAPAHTGASVATLALETASCFPFMRFFGALARFESPLIDQLAKKSSLLTQLLRDTNAACKRGANRHLIPCRIITAEYEKIVNSDYFLPLDPAPETIPNTTHTTVCKPQDNFLDPLELLDQCL